MTTIGESISRVRGIMKAAQEDAFLPDRFVYSIITKYAKMVIKEQEDKRKLMSYDDLFEMIEFVELIEVNKIEAGCAPVKSTCTIHRTKDKLPKLFNGSNGPLIRKVYSIDGSQELEPTKVSQFISIANSPDYKYNTAKHYWFRNDYLYFPNTDIEGVMIDALWEDLLDGYCTLDNKECTPMQERPFPLPDHLFARVEQMAEQEFGISVRVPDDGADDGQNILR